MAAEHRWCGVEAEGVVGGAGGAEMVVRGGLNLVVGGGGEDDDGWQYLSVSFFLFCLLKFSIYFHF